MKDFVIIGSGLGGLATASILSEKGFKGVILEKTKKIGGRFSNIDYNGYQLTTGAVHMIPHGKNGPCGKFCKHFLPSLKILPCSPSYGVIHLNNGETKHLTNRFHPIYKNLDTYRDYMYSLFLYKALLFPPSQTYTKDWLESKLNSSDIHKWFSCFSKFSLGLEHDIVELSELIGLLRTMLRCGGPGIPLGGNQSVTSGLSNYISSHGSEVHANTKVKEIIIDGSKAVGVVYVDDVGEHELYSKLIINNAGPYSFLDFIAKSYLEKDFIAKIKKSKPVLGIKTSFSASKPILGHSCISWFLEHERVGGIVEPTNADPTLAPKGKHLLLTHQIMKSNNITCEIKKGIEETYSLLPELEKYGALLTSQVHLSNNPVNWTQQGYEFDWKTPITNLFLVGDSVKQRGYIMAEGVIKGAMSASKDAISLLKNNSSLKRTK